MGAKPKRKAAKKAARKKVGKTTRSKAMPPAAGPVTLEEARALTVAKQPALAARKAGAVPATSPAPLGAERKRLDATRESEFERRVREYKSTIEIMKKRGARAPAARKTAKGRTAGGATVAAKAA